MTDNLPPLPEGDIKYSITDSTMRRMECDAHSDDQMQAYARTALAQAQSCVPAGWREAAQEFVDRCDAGEVRSVKTYTKFKALLAASPQPQPVHDEIAYKEAVNLATALFKKHFAHEEHYASGRIVWGPCDTTAGVISQVDNMVCRLVQPQPVQPSDTQWQKRHPLRTEGKWESTNEHDAKWWRDHSQGWEIRVLYAHPVAQANPEQAAQPFLTCTCFNETDRMYCTSKGKCSRIVAAAAPQPKD